MKKISQSIYVGTNGCFNARATSVLTGDAIIHANYCLTEDPTNADLLIYATCGVKGDREKSSIDGIEELVKGAKQYARIIVSGCLPSINSPLLEELFGDRIEIVPSHELPIYLNVLSEYQDANRKPLTVNHGSGAYLPEENIRIKIEIRDKLYEIDPVLSEYYEATTPGLQLGRENDLPDTVIASRGCFYRCTYCDIWRAIGPYTSKPLEDILRIVNLSQNRRIVITADELGLYGKDLLPEKNLADLSKALLDTQGHQFYFRNIEPKPLIEFQKEILELAEKRKLLYVSSPMQSASKKLLKEMHRPYSPDDALAVLRLLKEMGVIIETHIMVGFPGETIQMFQDSLDFVHDLRPDSLSVVRYSDRPSAPARNFEVKIPEVEMQKRQQEILDLFKMQIAATYEKLLPYNLAEKQELIQQIVDVTVAV